MDGLRTINSAEAEKMPGVLAILHHGNIEKMYHPAGNLEESSRPGESRPPFEDENIYYYGQFVALVIANTFEQAQDAASHVDVEYDAKPPEVRLDAAARAPMGEGDASDKGQAGSTKYARGQADSAFDQAEIKLDETYVTPVETHNPMELHATIAKWDEDQNKITLYETYAGSGESPQRCLASSGNAAGIDRSDLSFRRLWLWQQAVPLAAFVAGGGGSAPREEACEAGGAPPLDVHDCGSSSDDPTARSHWRERGRQNCSPSETTFSRARPKWTNFWKTVWTRPPCSTVARTWRRISGKLS